MKLVHAGIRFDAPGGAESHIKAITTRLADRGHEVVVHASDLYSEIPWERMDDPSTQVDGVRVERHRVVKELMPGLRYPLMPSLIDGLLDEDADVYHAHSHRYFQVRAAQLVARATGTPLVITPHFHPAQEDLPWWKKGLARIADLKSGRAVYADADRVVCVTEGEIERMSDLVDPDRCEVIPNAIDAEDWADLPPPADDDWEDPVWLYAGRLAENKGLHHLLPAFARDVEARGAGTLVLMGQDWGQGEALARQAEELGVADRIEVLGFVDWDRYRAVHRRADVFCLPSEWEAFGIVLLEAWAAGTPVVATRVGGVPWVVDDGEDGLVVPYGDVAALADAAGELLDDPDRAEAMGRRGRDKTFERFTWSGVVDDLEALYREVVG